MSCNCCHPSGCSPEKKKNEYIPAIISFTMLTVGMILNHFNLFTLPGSALIWYTVAYLPDRMACIAGGFRTTPSRRVLQ